MNDEKKALDDKTLEDVTGGGDYLTDLRTFVDIFMHHNCLQCARFEGDNCPYDGPIEMYNTYKIGAAICREKQPI